MPSPSDAPFPHLASLDWPKLQLGPYPLHSRHLSTNCVHGNLMVQGLDTVFQSAAHCLNRWATNVHLIRVLTSVWVMMSPLGWQCALGFVIISLWPVWATLDRIEPCLLIQTVYWPRSHLYDNLMGWKWLSMYWNEWHIYRSQTFSHFKTHLVSWSVRIMQCTAEAYTHVS